MSDFHFVPSILRDAIDPSQVVEAEPIFPLALQSPSFDRATRPLSRSRRLFGVLAGIGLIGFTVFMVSIVLFDGDPRPGCLHDLMARKWSYEDSTEGYSAWNFCIPDCVWKKRVDRESGAILAGPDPESVFTAALKAMAIIISMLAGLMAVPTWKKLAALEDAQRSANQIISRRPCTRARQELVNPPAIE